MSLIPTPRRLEYLPGRIPLLPAEPPASVSLCGEHAALQIGADWINDAILRIAGERLPIGSTPGERGVVLGTFTDLAGEFGGVATRAAAPSLLTPVGREQGYFLWCEGGRLVVAGHTPQGVLYGAATVAQLVQGGPGEAWLPRAEVEDWPTFRYRSLDWLINVEINRWAYDWGEGRAGYEARVRHKLDWCARHKLNMVYFDGFGWSLDRCEEYGALMQGLTHYARERGIRLLFVGYGSEYKQSHRGSELYRAPYFGEVHWNRHSYPEGETYECIGNEGFAQERQAGTCPSNEELIEHKLAELTAFVRTVEPGAVYIHDIDAGDYESTRRAWQVRCPTCRERWPNDTLEAEDGAAGAYAHWFGHVVEALSAIRNPASGYDAARDCTIIFTGPLYTGWEEAHIDEVWPRSVEYFATLSRLLGPAPNVELCIREQFLLSDSSGGRVEQLAAALASVGHGHGVHVVAFNGGDMYYSDSLVPAAGALCHYYRGAESVSTANGGVHEEVVQAFNAEFLWNSGSSRLRPPNLDAERLRSFIPALRKGTVPIQDVHEPGGLYDRLCREVFGARAGALLFEAFCTEFEFGIPPVARVWWTVTTPVSALLQGVAPAELARLTELWPRRHQATRKARALAQQALAADDLTPELAPYVAWLVRSLDVGERFAALLCRVCVLLAQTPTSAEAEAVLGEIGALKGFLTTEFELQTVDPLGGDPAAWIESADRLEQVVRQAISSGN